MKLLRRTQFGDPILRQIAHRLTEEQILSDQTQQLIADMHYTLQTKNYGVGLAAPQVGKPLAISVIGIKPTASRPNNPVINMTIINPTVLEFYGDSEPMWEGCLSFGDTKNFPYAQVPRYKRLRLQWLDEQAKKHEADFEGILAHVLQHEVDHLNGVLFVDKVEDPSTYMTISEYKKRFLKTATIDI